MNAICIKRVVVVVKNLVSVINTLRYYENRLLDIYRLYTFERKKECRNKHMNRLIDECNAVYSTLSRICNDSSYLDDNTTQCTGIEVDVSFLEYIKDVTIRYSSSLERNISGNIHNNDSHLPLISNNTTCLLISPLVDNQHTVEVEVELDADYV